MCGCLGGHAWLLPGGACMVAPGGAWLLWGGGHAWLLWGACVVAPGGHAWLLPGGCMVARGGHAWLLGRGVRGFFDEIWSMSGRYASYWNAFFFFLVVHDKVQSLGGGGFEVPKVTQLIVLNQAYKLEDIVDVKYCSYAQKMVWTACSRDAPPPDTRRGGYTRNYKGGI